MKKIEWLGNSKDVVRSFPDDARQDASWQLELLQRGENPDDWKPMKTIGKGAREIRIREETGASSQISRKKVETMEREPLTSEVYESVWDALSDTAQEAENLKIRSALLYEIRKTVEKWNLSQEQAAKKLGLTRPRVNDLLRGKLSKFSLDALVNIAAAAHMHVELTLKEAA